MVNLLHFRSSTLVDDGDVLVTQNGSLTINGNFSNNGGDIELRSTSTAYAAMLVNGSSSGDIIYGRYVNIADTDEWDLVGSTVSWSHLIGLYLKLMMVIIYLTLLKLWILLKKKLKNKNQ